MKTYREMTESVLEKAGAEIVKKERRRRNGVFIAASGLCFALLVTVLGMGIEQSPTVVTTLPGEQPGLSADATDTPQPTQQAKVKITCLTNIEGQTTQKNVSPDVSIPLNGMIRIRDTRALTKEEHEKVYAEEMAIADEFSLGGKGSVIRWGYPGAITTIISNGGITLDFSDCSTVKNVDIETTGVGSVSKGARLFGPNPEKGTIYWPNVRKADFRWSISSELAFELHKDPTIPLESIRDTITIKIDYTNGTTETLIFDITVNEEGNIFVTQRGIPNTEV
ncbi:MAG: hypothetical protein IJF02_01015 [Oscillospiraceae bacterium]|nr:hypothetical protein [Oscillospiraceae bacterium]